MGELAGAGDGNDEQSPILTRTLNKVKRGFRKWHAYAIAAVVLVVVIVLVAVLVPVLLHQRDEKTRDEQQKVHGTNFLGVKFLSGCYTTQYSKGPCCLRLVF